MAEENLNKEANKKRKTSESELDSGPPPKKSLFEKTADFMQSTANFVSDEAGKTADGGPSSKQNTLGVGNPDQSFAAAMAELADTVIRMTADEHQIFKNVLENKQSTPNLGNEGMPSPSKEANSGPSQVKPSFKDVRGGGEGLSNQTVDVLNNNLEKVKDVYKNTNKFEESKGLASSKNQDVEMKTFKTNITQDVEEEINKNAESASTGIEMRSMSSMKKEPEKSLGGFSAGPQGTPTNDNKQNTQPSLGISSSKLVLENAAPAKLVLGPEFLAATKFLESAENLKGGRESLKRESVVNNPLDSSTPTSTPK